MDAAQDPPDWTREVAALRRVARALLADEHAADDVLQETWLRTHGRTAGMLEPAGYWKRAVANLVRDRRRGEARRAQREREVARPEALPSTDDVVARLDLVQRVARAAAELPEPYRSTIHLHYFEDRSAQEIAARAGVPLETVRTRIRRGLERMRSDLDASADGDRAAWCLALAPLALRHAHESTLAASGTLVATAGGLLAVNKLVIAAAGLIAVGALWFSTRGAPSAAPLAQVEPARVALAEPRDGTPATVDASSSPEPDESARTALDVEAASEPAQDGMLALTGTLTLIEESGRRRGDVDGAVCLRLHSSDGRYEDAYFEVVDGRWSARVPEEVRLSFVGAYAAGHPAHPTGDGRIEPSTELVELEAVPWPRTTLRVVDRSSGLDLEGIELRWGDPNYMEMAKRHPVDAVRMALQRLGLRSPFEIEWPNVFDESAKVRLWVCAPGLAWTWCDVLPRAGGQRTLELVPGGDLEVYPVGPRPDLEWMIYLVEIGDEPGGSEVVAWQYPAEGEVTRFDRLSPGTYRVGAMVRRLSTVGEGSSETFEVRAGETARVSLTLDELPATRAFTHLTGTLRWTDGTPLGEGTSYGDLCIHPVDGAGGQEPLVLRRDEMTPDADQARTLHWDAGRVVCGEYEATVFDAGVRQRFDTGTGPGFHLDLELAPRAQVLVRARDARDGSAISGFEAAWSVADAAAGPNVYWNERKDEFGKGFVRLDAPAVELLLSVTAPGCTVHRETVRLEPGEVRELDVRLARVTGLEVRLVEGEAWVPGVYARPRIIDPAGERVRAGDCQWDSSICRILLEPGTYRLSFVELDAGWRDAGWIDVRVVEGVLTPVDFPLERAP